MPMLDIVDTPTYMHNKPVNQLLAMMHYLLEVFGLQMVQWFCEVLFNIVLQRVLDLSKLSVCLPSLL